MQIVGHGVDIVVCSRIERIWRAHGEAFLHRVFTTAERDYCLNCRTPVVRLAGRFAAKEAVLKALGTGWRGGIRWTDVEVLPGAAGAPFVHVHGECTSVAARLGIREWQLSISHAGEYAIASAIALFGGGD